MTTYVLTGDSQAEGLLAASALPNVLGEKLLGGYAHSGWSSKRLLDDGAIDEAGTRAARTGSTLVIVAGGNDPIPDSSTPGVYDAYKRTLIGILNRARSLGVRKLVWFGPVYALTDYDSRQHPAVALAQRRILATTEARAAAGRMSVQWIDSQPLTRDLARPENVHLTAAGYRTYAERVASKLEGGGLGTGLLITGLLVGGAAWYGLRGRR